jgi:hypothetical protein
MAAEPEVDGLAGHYRRRRQRASRQPTAKMIFNPFSRADLDGQRLQQNSRDAECTPSCQRGSAR